MARFYSESSVQMRAAFCSNEDSMLNKRLNDDGKPWDHLRNQMIVVIHHVGHQTYDFLVDNYCFRNINRELIYKLKSADEPQKGTHNTPNKH